MRPPKPLCVMIHKTLSFVAAASLFTGLPLFAGNDAGCSFSAKADCSKKSGCEDKLAKLNLTDEQKAKVAGLKDECEKAGCTDASMAAFAKALDGILTTEQLAALKAE